MITLSETIFPPFLKWGKYKSKDEKNPDVLEVELQEIDTFETEYSINVNAKIDGVEMALPLQSFGSNNRQLFQKWQEGISKKKIRVGKKFKLHTWLGTSKNNFTIRRFELVF
ncbi:MAG: hypothetical protein IIA83_01945 [Thaumarchaeota archaeon]|nr:hypothetical protein [Nitrososphaerota archaeon]